MELSEIAGQPERSWDTGPEGATDQGAGPGSSDSRGTPALARPGDLVPGGEHGDLSVLVLEQIEVDLADVERALERLDEGTYGTCERCGRPIGAERLETSPATRLCAGHAGAGAADPAGAG